MPIKFDDKGNPYPYGVVKIKIEKFKSIFSTIPNEVRWKCLFRQLGKYIKDFFDSIIPNDWIQWFGGN